MTRWLPPPEGRLIPVSETPLPFSERGTGFPLLVLPGGPGLDSTVFGSLLDPLGDRYRLVFVDGGSQGGSDRDTDPAT